MTALEKATRLVNRWVSDCLFLTPEMGSILLIQRIAEAIDKAEQEAIEAPGRLDEYE